MRRLDLSTLLAVLANLPSLSHSFAVPAALPTSSAQSNSSGLLGKPSPATHAAVDFFASYYYSKSAHNASAFLSHFSNSNLVYFDAVLGWGYNASTFPPVILSLFSSWSSNATSTPLLILGTTQSAILHSVDSPSEFGAELHILSAVDFRRGQIVRQVDYWDGRRNPVYAEAVPDNQYPFDLGASTIATDSAELDMYRIVQALSAAFAAGDAKSAAALFGTNAVFEDMTLRTRQEGRLAIGRYLQRALAKLPYGPGATLRHSLGGHKGGGYEWYSNDNSTGVLNGIVALELDQTGTITLLRTVWNGARMSDTAINTLVLLALEQ